MDEYYKFEIIEHFKLSEKCAETRIISYDYNKLKIIKWIIIINFINRKVNTNVFIGLLIC